MREKDQAAHAGFRAAASDLPPADVFRYTRKCFTNRPIFLLVMENSG
jgi:hypothetical protein